MRATLTALTFPADDGAHAVLDDVKVLSTRNLIKLHDAVVLWWPAGAGRPRTDHLADIVSPFAVGVLLAGLVMGLLFAAPLFGAAVGLATGTSLRALSVRGVDTEFIAAVREQVTPGTSALFLLTSDADVDEVTKALRGTEMRLAATTLSDEQAQQLRTCWESMSSRARHLVRHPAGSPWRPEPRTA